MVRVLGPPDAEYAAPTVAVDPLAADVVAGPILTLQVPHY
jgi:hypothetical protein